MKTPEEIKKGLDVCSRSDAIAEHDECEGCPYYNNEDQILCGINTMMKDSIDYIEQLEKNTKWISVKDRMPEDFKTVIVLRDDLPGGLVDVTWVIAGLWGVPKGVNVTHWMPMPEPPEEE